MDLTNGADPGSRDGPLHRSIGVTVRAVRKEKREVDFVASTDCIDSYDEIVEQSWDLKRFQSNPVILFGHKSRELPIGRATRCEVVNGALECTIRFASAEANPLAEQVMRLVEEQCLNAVSVGFYPRTVKWEKRDDREVLVLSDNELHEISVVSIPANPEALAKMKAKAVAEAKATATQRAAMAQENGMTLEEQLKAEKDLRIAREVECRAAETKALELAKSNEALSLQAKTLTEQRDAATVRADAAEGSLVELEVDALVGVKITPAQKPEFLKMAKLDKSVFASVVAGLPATGVLAKLGEQSVLPKEAAPLENGVAKDAAGDAGNELNAEVKRLAKGA